MNESMLLVAIASCSILVGIFLSDKYLLKTQSSPRAGKYAIALHRAFDLVAVVLIFGGAYLLLLHGKAWVLLAFSIGLLWPELPIAIDSLKERLRQRVVRHQVFEGYWDEAATEHNLILDGKIWLSVIIALIMTLLVMSWSYYS
jgi:hypothetical protein